MTDPNSYSELVSRAEEAVASVKDPELKRVAFEKVLDNLLGSQSSKRAETDDLRGRKAPKAKKSSRVAKGGPKAYVEELISDGFFKKPKPLSEVKIALENLGHHIPVTSLSGPLQKLCQQKLLRRQKLGDSGTYTYSEW
jgi:hypothetical protein